MLCTWILPPFTLKHVSACDIRAAKYAQVSISARTELLPCMLQARLCCAHNCNMLKEAVRE